MISKGVITTVQKKEEYFVQFTPEEMELLGIKPGDKFELSHQEPATLVLKKMPSIDIDLHAMDKDTLAAIISMSVEQQLPADDIIRDMLTKYLSREKQEVSSQPAG